MTKREAKRLVCRVYATTIQSDFELDAEWLRENLNGEEYSEDDKSRIMSACYELQDELFDRGGGMERDWKLESRAGFEPANKWVAAIRVKPLRHRPSKWIPTI